MIVSFDRDIPNDTMIHVYNLFVLFVDNYDFQDGD